MTYRIVMPNIQPNRQSTVRIVPTTDLRKLHRLMVVIVLLQVVNLALELWGLF